MMTESYYSEKLSAERLKLCYDLAPEAVCRLLESESEYVRQRIQRGSLALELGCGYGRVLRDLSISGARMLAGIDISLQSIRMAQSYLAGIERVMLYQMDGLELAFPTDFFDVVCCIQNGISAFHVDQRALLKGAVRVTKPGGRVIFSSYAESFWEERLNWFQVQSSHGLVGEIDENATGQGVIVCKDGFTATTASPSEFRALSSGLGHHVNIEEIPTGSVFCEILV